MSMHVLKWTLSTPVALFALHTALAAAPAPSAPCAARLAPSGLHARPASARPARAPWMGGIIEAVHAPVPVDVPAGSGSGRRTFEVLTASGFPDDANPYPDSPFSGLMPATDYGYSIALEGDRLFVGSLIEFSTFQPDVLGTGGVYFYRKIDGHWQLQQKLLGDDSVDEDEFGVSVAVSGDTLVVGAQQASVNGNAVQGAAYVFDFDAATGQWTQTQKLVADDGGPQEAFGHMIAIEGDHALIDAVLGTADGNYGIGAVYAFTRSNGTWTQTGKLTPDLTNVTDMAFYGWSIALDGDTALIGTPFANTPSDSGGQGVVEAFALAGGAWTRAQVLTPCGPPNQFPGFGWSIALRGTRAYIGSPVGGGDSTQSNGVVCAYDEAGGNWSETSRLAAADGQPYDAFGTAVAFRDDTVAIGADPGFGNGIGYVFVDGVQSDEFVQPIRQGIVLDGSAVIGTNMSNVNIQDFPPVASVAPSPLTFALAPGGTDSATLAVANQGIGSVLDFVAGDDGSVLRQTASYVPSRAVSQTCSIITGDTAPDARPRGTGDTSWWRRFSFGDYAQVGASATIAAITVGVDSAPDGAPFTINLYAMPHDVDADTIDDTRLTLIGSVNATAPGTHVSRSIDVPVQGTIADTAADDLVVEYRVSPGDVLQQTLPMFVPSSNLSPETHPTFLSSPTYCASIFSSHPTAYAAWGSVLMDVHLQAAAPSDMCATPASAPWLSVASQSTGHVAAGASTDVGVSVNTAGLAEGNYAANLCVRTSDTAHPFVVVPVALSVGERGDLIFANGFDGTP